MQLQFLDIDFSVDKVYISLFPNLFKTFRLFAPKHHQFNMHQDLTNGTLRI